MLIKMTYPNTVMVMISLGLFKHDESLIWVWEVLVKYS